MSTFENSEDPDEMQHNAAFHQGLHCLIGKKDFQTKEFNIFFNYNLTPLDMYKRLSHVYRTRRKNPSVYKGLSRPEVTPF